MWTPVAVSRHFDLCVAQQCTTLDTAVTTVGCQEGCFLDFFGTSRRFGKVICLTSAPAASVQVPALLAPPVCRDRPTKNRPIPLPSTYETLR